MKKILVKKILAATALAATFLLPSQGARADENEEICAYYGNVGAATVEFLLPLSFRQVVKLIAGKDDTLAKSLDGRLQRLQSARIKAMLDKIGPDAIGLLGESAGFQAFQMAVSGRATEGGQVFMAMTNACQQMGAETIIANQRKKRQQSQPKVE